MQTNRFTQLSIGLLVSLLVCGCGFHLRGTMDQRIENKAVYIFSAQQLNSDISYRRFKKALTQTLTEAGASVNPSSDTQQWANNELANSTHIEVNIVRLTYSAQGITRDALGRANEYELSLRLDYQLLDVDKMSLTHNSVSENKIAIAVEDQGIAAEKQATATEDQATATEDQTTAGPQSFVLTATQSYISDYLNPAAARQQKQDAEARLIAQISQRLSRQISVRLNL